MQSDLNSKIKLFEKCVDDIGAWWKLHDQKKVIKAFIDITVLINTNKLLVDRLKSLPPYAYNILFNPIFCKAYLFSNIRSLTTFANDNTNSIYDAFNAGGIVQDVIEFIDLNHEGFMVMWEDFNWYNYGDNNTSVISKGREFDKIIDNQVDRPFQNASKEVAKYIEEKKIPDEEIVSSPVLEGKKGYCAKYSMKLKILTVNLQDYLMEIVKDITLKATKILLKTNTGFIRVKLRN